MVFRILFHLFGLNLRIFAKFGKGSVPIDLYPKMHERAETILAGQQTFLPQHACANQAWPGPPNCTSHNERFLPP